MFRGAWASPLHPSRAPETLSCAPASRTSTGPRAGSHHVATKPQGWIVRSWEGSGVLGRGLNVLCVALTRKSRRESVNSLRLFWSFLKRPGLAILVVDHHLGAWMDRESPT